MYLNNLINKICWPVHSLIPTANPKLAHPLDCLHTNYIKNNTLENSQIQKGINKKKVTTPQLPIMTQDCTALIST